MARSEIGTTARALLLGGLALFVAAMAMLIFASVGRRRMTTYALSPAAALQPAASAARTVTLDARNGRAWTFLDLAAGRASAGVSPPASWDLAVRRHEIRVGRAAADLGAVPFDSVRQAPADGWTETRPRATPPTSRCGSGIATTTRRTCSRAASTSTSCAMATAGS